MNFVAISDARANLPDIVNKVGKNSSRVTITVNGKPMAVLLGAEELESLEETAEILAIPGARRDIKQGLKEIRKGDVVPFEEVVGKAPKQILKE